MTQIENIDLAKFLKSGAFLRDSSGKLHIWMGPFKSSKTPQNFSVALMDFYTGIIDLRAAEAFHFDVSIPSLRTRLQQYFQPALKQFDRSLLNEPSLKDFESVFQLIKGKIARGEIEKAVPTVQAWSATTFSEQDLCGSLIQVLEANPETMPYGFWDEGRGWVGVSPEILFSLNSGRLKTVALAGTCPKSEVGGRPSLLKDPKELKEHLYVIEDLISKLGRYGHIHREPTRIIDLGTLLHLKTDLSIEGHHWDVFDLLKRLHPTAALGIWPQNYGIQWMRSLPFQENRSQFGAPMTFQISPDHTESIVAIRNLEWTPEQVRINTGCGLVAESDLQREWQELTVKRIATLKNLGF